MAGAMFHNGDTGAFLGRSCPFLPVRSSCLCPCYFPVTVLANTDNYQQKTTDSAASGTAIACGVKTYNGAIGVDPKRKPVVSLAKLLRDRKFSVGVITSVGLNDATPATHYANRTNRRDAVGTKCHTADDHRTCGSHLKG